MENVVGYRIRCLREERGWTQAELADELHKRYNLNTHRVTVTNWENGKLNPNIYPIKCMADLFGVTMDWVIGMSDSRYNDDPDEIREELRSNPKLRMLLSASSKLGQADMDRLIAIAEVLNKESVR